MRPAIAATLFLVAATGAYGQWTVQESHTRAGLRGIDALDGDVAWASGAAGTILRTTDGGLNWHTCAVPQGAENLDFRGVQALDRDTAVVMSSGKGDLSRLYKTADGCRTWRLIFTNPDAEGFWDAIRLSAPEGTGRLYGDPVEGKFAAFVTHDSGETWSRAQGAPARDGECLFAASNSSLLFAGQDELLVSGCASGSRGLALARRFAGGAIPLAVSASGGAFSVAISSPAEPVTLVVVGGDFRKPEVSQGTAAFSLDEGRTWTAPTTPPHGYRSSVAYESKRKLWIAVGPNGTDISTDGGRTWRAVKPSSGEKPDADRNWNALSLPFVVGPDGRIGRLDADARMP